MCTEQTIQVSLLPLPCQPWLQHAFSIPVSLLTLGDSQPTSFVWSSGLAHGAGHHIQPCAEKEKPTRKGLIAGCQPLSQRHSPSNEVTPGGPAETSCTHGVPGRCCPGTGTSVLALARGAGPGSSAWLLWPPPAGAQRRQNAHPELFIQSALALLRT